MMMTYLFRSISYQIVCQTPTILQPIWNQVALQCNPWNNLLMNLRQTLKCFCMLASSLLGSSWWYSLHGVPKCMFVCCMCSHICKGMCACRHVSVKNWRRTSALFPLAQSTIYIFFFHTWTVTGLGYSKCTRFTDY